MQIHDIEPDIFSYTALITLYGYMEKMEQVKMYIDEMKNKGISLTGETYGLLIQIYGRVSNYDAIDNLLKEMKSRNIRLDYRIHSILTKIYTERHRIFHKIIVWLFMPFCKFEAKFIFFKTQKHFCHNFFNCKSS